MDSFQNPQQFQNSSIVQKSSKTGIFSNKRLLVIKNGYLYYFSKVPKGYKSHVPNILTTFTDLPKSSIEIKNILDIRLQSTKSSNLIIKFYLRDMIDRQDIRKSIDTHSYMLPQKKGNTDFDEWKFTFTTVLQCRLWFNALIKLKDYFKNLDIKFQKFVSNFDKRNSVAVDSKELRTQSQLKLPISTNNLTVNNSNISLQKPQQSRKTQPINFDASKFIGSIPQKQLSPLNNKVNIDQKLQIPLRIHIQETKADKIQISKIISQQDQDSENGYHPDISQIIQPQIPIITTSPIKKVQSFKSTLKQSHLIQPINEDEQIKIRQLQQEIRQQVKQQVQQKVRLQVQAKFKQKHQKQKRQEMTKFRAQVQLKQLKIKQLQTQIHIKHLANMEKQKLIEEEKRLLQHKIYEEQQKLKQYQITVENQIKQQAKAKLLIAESQKNKKIHANNVSKVKRIVERDNRKWLQAGDQYEIESNQQQQNFQDNTYKKQYNDRTKPSMAYQNHIQVHEFSVQTDDQQFHINQSTDQFQPHFNFSKQMSHSKQLNLSKETKIRNSFFSDYLTSNRNTLPSERYRIQEDILPLDQSQEKQEFSKFNYFYELQRIFQNDISSGEKIQRQIKLLKYVNFIKNQIVKIAHEYIDKNHPNECISFEKGFLSFDLACAPGKVMNIGGEKKLIYSNKRHENLKRTFKIYQRLQNQIIKLIKNKKNFPIRVPLCTLVQCKGYTILGKVEICCYEQDSLEKDKYLKYILPPVFHSSVQLSKTIQIDDQNQYFMVKVLKPFKLTDEQKSSNVLNFNNNFHLCQNQITKSRASSISICYEKLAKEIDQKDDQNNQVNEIDQETKNNQIYCLRLIKLTRELKKIFKSIDPFSKNNGQDQNISNQNQMKSQFLQKLFTHPEDLLGLIPSDIDFKVQDLQCGYFWSLLEFFLGIRFNESIKQDTQHPSYRLVPVVRTFHLQYLLCSQYCQKIDKYLSMNNIDSAQNCWKLMKKVSFNEFQASLTEIKILLKKKQYAIAEEKIYYLRQSLPLHDLKNIQINAYLIECYIFMGLQTQALKEIKSSLQYVEYLFGDKKNLYKQNLHLLMAETLLKMGNIKEAIKLYKSLLKFDKINKQQILISFAQNLVQDYRFYPDDSIPFLIECIEEVNIPEKKIQLFLCIAKLYSRSQRKDKCIFYLQKGYELGLASKSYHKLLPVYQMLMTTLPNQSRKQTLYRNFLKQVQSKFFSNHQNCKYFNTINLYLFISQNQNLNKTQAIELFQELKIQSGNEMAFHIELQDWETLKNCANLLENPNQASIENNLKSIKKILESVDIDKILVQLTKSQKKILNYVMPHK